MDHQRRRRLVQIGIIVLLILFGGWALLGFFLIGCNVQSVGVFGDFFGALNSLISILGFGAVVYAIQKEHEDDDADDERHKSIIRLQEETATAQRNQARTSLIAANLDAHSSSYAFAVQELRLLDDAAAEFRGDLTAALEAHNMPFGQWAFTSHFISRHAAQPLIRACERVRRPVDLDNNAALEAGAILQAWDDLTEDLKRDIEVAKGLQAHYRRVLLEGDQEAMAVVAHLQLTRPSQANEPSSASEPS